MKTNVGNKERVARVLAGLALLKSAKSKKIKLLGLLPLLSGATGHCPCYSKVGINTAVCQAKAKNPEASKSQQTHA